MVDIFVRYDRDDTIVVKELERIMAEYGKIKSIKSYSVLKQRNRKQSNDVLRCLIWVSHRWKRLDPCRDDITTLQLVRQRDGPI